MKHGTYGGESAEKRDHRKEHDRKARVLGEGEVKEVPFGKEKNAEGVQGPRGNDAADILFSCQGGFELKGACVGFLCHGGLLCGFFGGVWSN
jgi:hypothetical protein